MQPEEAILDLDRRVTVLETKMDTSIANQEELKAAVADNTTMAQGIALSVERIEGQIEGQGKSFGRWMGLLSLISGAIGLIITIYAFGQ